MDRLRLWPIIFVKVGSTLRGRPKYDNKWYKTFPHRAGRGLAPAEQNRPKNHIVFSAACGQAALLCLINKLLRFRNSTILYHALRNPHYSSVARNPDTWFSQNRLFAVKPNGTIFPENRQIIPFIYLQIWNDMLNFEHKTPKEVKLLWKT